MKEQVSALAKAVFTKRQLLVLGEAQEFSGQATASSFVRFLVAKHGFSETSAWHTMRKFRKLGFVEYGNGTGFMRFTEFSEFLFNGGGKNGRKK